ncbi:MAG: hypothetical protein MJ165_02800 [Alphaproteobacteria bacterium]|nr:hypothetical protein [Alphaproteobacteria bacterium]
MEHRDVNINNTVEVSGMGCIIVAVVVFCSLGVCFLDWIVKNSELSTTEIKKQTEIMRQRLDVAKKQYTLDSLRYYDINKQLLNNNKQK